MHAHAHTNIYIYRINMHARCMHMNGEHQVSACDSLLCGVCLLPPRQHIVFTLTIHTYYVTCCNSYPLYGMRLFPELILTVLPFMLF